MTEGDAVELRSAYEPGEAVWVFVLGTWQPAVVLGSADAGHVLARYHRLDGEPTERAFPQSSVVRPTDSDPRSAAPDTCAAGVSPAGTPPG